MSFLKEAKPTRNGIPYNIFCHIQKTNKSGLVCGAHYHNYIEMLYGIEGVFEVHINNKTYQFESGDLVLINPQEVHQIDGLSEKGGKYYVVRFEPEIIYTLSQNVFEMKYYLPLTLNNYNHQKVFKNDIIQSTYIPELLKEIMDEFSKQEYAYELAIKAHICKIFLWILRYWNESGLKIDSFFDMDQELLKKLHRVFHYVEEKYNTNIKLSQMAKLCNMSYSYFSRTFNRLMRTSFNQYVNYVRIKEAEKLLVTSNLNITEIAMKVGFSTSSYFIKQFKQHKNLSPKQYKKTFIQIIEEETILEKAPN